MIRRALAKLRAQSRRPLVIRSLPASALELSRHGPTPLLASGPATDQPLHIATVIPWFAAASGGHATIVNLLRELSQGGHRVTLWLEDSELRHADVPAAETQRRFASYFGAGDLDFHVGFADWRGADLVLATGFQTVPRVLLLDQAKSRAYLVQDHEPDFYGASAEAIVAAATYRRGLHCIAASPWLADLLRARYGASASPFDLAVDHSIYRPLPEPRREDVVVFYARAGTPRRAVPLGLLALEELSRRRPTVEIALFGEARPIKVPFRHRHLGVLSSHELAELYSRSAVGVAFSLTNPSLVCLEMMACGLPCVELATDANTVTFGQPGPLRLAEPDPLAVCEAIEQLLDDREAREAASRRGLAFMQDRTWSRAGIQVQSGLRAAIATTA